MCSLILVSLDKPEKKLNSLFHCYVVCQVLHRKPTHLSEGKGVHTTYSDVPELTKPNPRHPASERPELLL